MDTDCNNPTLAELEQIIIVDNESGPMILINTFAYYCSNFRTLKKIFSLNKHTDTMKNACLCINT